MVWSIAAAVVLGLLLGRYLLPPSFVPLLGNIVTYALAAMVFGVGLDIGRNRDTWQRMQALGWRVLIVPLAIACGSLAGAMAAKLVVAMPLKEILAIGAGFGWYSLSGVLIAQFYSVELGATAFLANVFRELMAFVFIPLLVGYVGKLTAIAPGGATTMDSTLPVITKTTDAQTALIAFMSGLVLTAIVPVLVPFILSL